MRGGSGSGAGAGGGPATHGQATGAGAHQGDGDARPENWEVRLGHVSLLPAAVPGCACACVCVWRVRGQGLCSALCLTCLLLCTCLLLSHVLAVPQALDEFLDGDDARRADIVRGGQAGHASGGGSGGAHPSASPAGNSGGGTGAGGHGTSGSGGAPVVTPSADLERMLSAARQRGRSGSPIIIWRSSAKVSLADNVPRELSAAALNAGKYMLNKQSHVEATTHSSYRPQAVPSSSSGKRPRGGARGR